MAVKIFLFQANSNLIGHLQLESCKMGKLPVQRKERKIKHTQIRDFPRANLGPVIGPYFFPNRDRNSQIL